MWNIVVTDDEPIIARTVAKLLAQGQYSERLHIRTAKNGAEALQLMEQEICHILFTDIRMPVMDGLELTRRVREQYPSTLTVVISGYGDFHYAQQCMQHGVKEYLLKPPSKEELNRLLGKLIGELENAWPAPASITIIDTWSERLAEAIWSQDLRLIDTLVQELIEHGRAFCYTPAQTGVFIEESCGLLLRKINARGIYSLQEEEFVDTSAVEDPMERLRQRIAFLSEWIMTKRRGNAKDPIEEAKTYIDHHLADEADLEEVAEILGISATYFSHLFKQRTGETFVKYRMRKRLERAKLLLELPQYRITDVSMEVGYTDPTHFSKLFKKYNGLTPSEYREKLGIS
ncbi:helix-turn-helix domain-containing protein [Paenibacillus silviterrae]|uniref:helix-turn-helix domain-containing protein n=1 Tax=Paenibacillus silviterrae TaxID=3242194 RepID=UPI002542E5F8|nr:helix-turn-helix domain-containing protein [Paenibacillus chinjuensis]